MFCLGRRLYHKSVPVLRFISRGPRPDPNNSQIQRVRSLTQEDIENWPNVKCKLLKAKGNMNDKNCNAIVMKTLLTCSKIDIASSFANYIHANEEELSLGTLNALFEFYTHLRLSRALTDEEKQFIINSYDKLYKKYKILDYITCEKLLLALCAVNEWKKAIKVLEDLKQSAVPPHSVYSELVSVLFNCDKKKEALKIAEDSISNKRALEHNAYVAWVNYILRKYKDKNKILKNLNEINVQIKNSFTIITVDTAELLLQNYVALGWTAKYTRIRKINGQCIFCKKQLECLSPTDEEFAFLQENIRARLIEGSDLFLKSSPDELKRFLEFIESNAPFDVVIDALNIAFAYKRFSGNKLGLLNDVVNHFLDQQKKVLVLGRKHMLNWNKAELRRILSKTSSFFTDNLSQDDPYFITAAILSGSHTDIVSKDLLRGHCYNLKDNNLKNIFRRWQWQHQWMVFMSRNGIHIQAPLCFTPCPQGTEDSWHIPFESADERFSDSNVNDGIPDLTSWLCISRR